MSENVKDHVETAKAALFLGKVGAEVRRVQDAALPGWNLAAMHPGLRVEVCDVGKDNRGCMRALFAVLVKVEDGDGPDAWRCLPTLTISTDGEAGGSYDESYELDPTATQVVRYHRSGPALPEADSPAQDPKERFLGEMAYIGYKLEHDLSSCSITLNDEPVLPQRTPQHV